MKIIAIFISLLLVGCATTYAPARDYAARGNTIEAYDRLTYELHNNRKGDTQYAHAFVDEFPAVRSYGNSLFTTAYLADYVEKQSSMEWIQRRLTTYCATNLPEDCAATIQRVKDAEKNRKPKLNVLTDVFGQLTENEQDKLRSKYSVVLLDRSHVGVIMDRQVENLSTPGSAAGSVAGAATGSAIYNVNSVSSSNPKNWTYSPMADLGSAVLGAVVGSAADRAPIPRFRFRYGIKLLDGNTVAIDDEGQSAVGLVIGTCVYVKGFYRVADSLCTMTTDKLRAELGR